ncbi:HNH endonuclease signature motif containing protein [Armatimonas sp.]|uniref:HNH endonuclease n=1 Tax=Armatimonas sp. TaxID=1872638 RepID=UPI00286A93E6|nr:HNH endonuclease signature motif containing protein [Armatimonas sp.]
MTERLRQTVRERARGHCEYCLAPDDHSSASFTIDHLRPRSAQGSDDPANLAWSCWNCNSHKAAAMTALDPLTNQQVALFHPRTDTWEEHFRWDEEQVRVEGITPTGRATVERLQMNEPAIVNLRRLLMLIERHPPVL